MMNNFNNFNRGALMANNMRGNMGGMRGGRGGMNNMMPMGGMGMGNMGMNPMTAGMGMAGRYLIPGYQGCRSLQKQVSKGISSDLVCSIKEILAAIGVSMEQSDNDKSE